MARTRAHGGRLLLFTLMLSLAAALVTPATVGAQADDDIASIQLQLRRSSSGVSVVPVDVVLIARRALEAELVIEASAARVNWTIPVQLAANTEARETILLPVAFNEVNLVARLVADGEELAESRIERFGGAAGPVNAVGLLGLDGPDEVDLAPDTGRASLLPLDDVSLLPGLDSIVTSPAGLRSLGPAELDQLWSWVVAGGQLVVADDPGSLGGIVPPAWDSESPTVQAGGGLLRYVGSTDWQNQVPPGVRISNEADFVFGQFGGELAPSELLSDAGFRVPGLGVIALVLGLYLLIAGPVTFGVLASRGRQTAAWVVLPGLAVLFTLIVFGVGGILTSGRGNGYATIAEVSPVGVAITDTILIADSGEQTLDLPDGLSLISGRLQSFTGGQGTPVVVEPRAGGDRLVFEIETGSGGTAILSGHADDLADSLTISDLDLDGSILTGTVTNTTGEDLEESIVMVGSRLETLGVLRTGASTPFTIDLEGRARNPLPDLREWEIGFNFRDLDAFGNPNLSDDVVDGPVNGAAWADWRRRRGDTGLPSGMVSIVGWTRDLELSPLGGIGRTAVVARSPLPAGARPIHPLAIRAISVTPLDFEAFEFGRAASTVLQFIRPPGADTSEVAFEIPETVGDVQVWIDGEWRSLDLPDFGRVVVVPPEEGWQGDTMWVDAGGPGFFEPGLPQLELRDRPDTAMVVDLLPEGERSRREGGFGGPFEEPFFENIELNRSEEIELDADLGYVTDGEIFNSYDEFVLVLEEGDRIEIEMTHLNNGLDPLLRLRDPNGRQAAENDDDPRGRGLNSYIDYEVREGGPHVIEARPLGGGQNGAYELVIRVTRSGVDS